MKVVAVSDTHMPRMAKKLPERLVLELADADRILHAGDWTSEEVYEQLARFAPVDGVAGNNDGELLVKKFGLRKTVRIGDARIGLVHGHSSNSKVTAERFAASAFGADEADVVVFGHSHIPLMRSEGGILLFNPGSPTDKRRQKQFSFGILVIDGGNVEARHVFYNSKE
nr:metallophosphoesterase [Cohnella candidum]